MNYGCIGKTKKFPMPHVNKKSLARKGIFLKPIFSLYFKIRVKKFYAAKPLAFSLHFLFRRDQNYRFNLTSKIIKMCEQILKKDSAPIQFEFFELKKKASDNETNKARTLQYSFAELTASQS